jgi:hypothetical protein
MVLTSIAETRWCEVNHTDIVAIYFGDIDYSHLEKDIEVNINCHWLLARSVFSGEEV